MKRLYWIIAIGVLIIFSVILIKYLNGNKPTEVYVEKATTKTIIELVKQYNK